MIRVLTYHLGIAQFNLRPGVFILQFITGNIATVLFGIAHSLTVNSKTQTHSGVNLVPLRLLKTSLRAISHIHKVGKHCLKPF